MTQRSHWWLACFALTLSGLGCVGSPQPSPPNLAPEGISRRSNPADIMDGILVMADPGTVSPAEGVVVITNLDRVDPPVIEPVRGDGGFEIGVEGLPEDEYRIQIRSGAARSVPLDVTGERLSAALDPAPRPLAGCFTLEPAAELDLGEVALSEPLERAIEVRNDCPDPVSIVTSVREPGAPITLSSTPAPIGAGETLEVVVRAAPIEPGSIEATVFIEATAPMRDRRPLTLFLRGTE